MWEIALLGIVVLFLGVSIIVMAVKTKSPGTVTLDTSNLAEQIAKAVAKEVREALRDLPRGGIIRARDLPTEGQIEMDESIVPMRVEAVATETNLQNMAKEEVKVDKDLADSKSKLANLLKKKKE